MCCAGYNYYYYSFYVISETGRYTLKVCLSISVKHVDLILVCANYQLHNIPKHTEFHFLVIIYSLELNSEITEFFLRSLRTLTHHTSDVEHLMFKAG
jgi:hypothetical protein